jgi:hypothetical protein
VVHARKVLEISTSFHQLFPEILQGIPRCSTPTLIDGEELLLSFRLNFGL